MRRVAATVIGALLPALSLPALAAGQAPPPAPAPAPASLSIALERVHRLGDDQVVLRGDRLRVRGSMSPFVAGQRVTVRLYRGRAKLAAKSVLVRQAGARGEFVVSLKPGKGRMTVRASHRGTAAQATAVAKARRVIGVTPRASLGDRGPAVRLLQSRLARLRYAVARTGRFDASTARAVIAYRKMRGWSRVGVASRDVVRGLLAGRGAFKAKYPSHGKHVEADLSRQVLVLLRGRRVERIYSTSSGAAVTPTVLGRFKVYSRTFGRTRSDGAHQLLHRRLRSTATRRCRRSPPATDACACRCRTRCRSTTGCGSATASTSIRS